MSKKDFQIAWFIYNNKKHKVELTGNVESLKKYSDVEKIDVIEDAIAQIENSKDKDNIKVKFKTK